MQYDAVGADQERLGRAVDAPVDTDAAIGVETGRNVRIAQIANPAQRLGFRVAPVDAVDRHFVFGRQLQQEAVLCAATGTPGSPDVHQRELACQVGRTDCFPRIAKHRQFENRCRLANERRRQRFWIAACQPDDEKYDQQRDKNNG